MGVVDTRFHDSRGDEHVDPFLGKLNHHVFHLARTHLAMRHAHARLGRSLMHALDCIVDSLHAVGHVVHLASATHLQTDGGTHYVGVVLAHMHDHRASSRRRRGDKAHVAHARDSHLHGTRNRRCRKREDIDLLAQVLELLLMLHAKTLLLVDDHQPQIVGVHIGGKQAMRSDEHIDLSFGKSRKRALLLPRRPKARKHIHFHAKGGKALKERLEMLLRQNGRGT